MNSDKANRMLRIETEMPVGEIDLVTQVVPKPGSFYMQVSNYKLNITSLKNLLARLLSLTKKFSARQKFSDGSEIRFVSRMTLRYTEGERSVDFGFHIYEGLIGSKASVSFWEVDCWNSPHDRLSVSAADKRCIAGRINEFCAARRIECTFDYERD